jgi:hypothetical protein
MHSILSAQAVNLPVIQGASYLKDLLGPAGNASRRSRNEKKGTWLSPGTYHTKGGMKKLLLCK